MSKYASQKGQTLLIVILVMVVSLTVGLSVVARSIVNLRTSTEEENSGRAFSAAEAGIEKALKDNCTSEVPCTGTFNENRAAFTASVVVLSGTEFLLNGGNPIPKNEGVDVWLVDHNNEDNSLNYTSGWQTFSDNAKLTFYWGLGPDECSNAAMEIIALTGTSVSPVTTRYTFDPCLSRSTGNKFAISDAGTYSEPVGKFYYRATIDILSSSKGIVVRAIPLYYSAIMAVKSCDGGVLSTDQSCKALPSQGKQIEATGFSGNTSRKVTFFQGYPSLPTEFFSSILFSPK